ncbi:MAG: molecular chaperone DnaK [Bacteroidetes bacterium]|nr:molecular chaperone DnaK [Bacteroidota bacterium]
MPKAIGIDLGTTFSVAAIAEGRRVKVLPNSEADHLTPSVVALTQNGRLLSGKLARAQAVSNPDKTISSIKRLMGSEQKIAMGKKQYMPQEISSFILSKIKGDIENNLGENISEVVITVPAYFDDNQRQATIEAGKLAGLNVMRIISEPTAAALAYGLHCDDIHHVLVWDLGGGTFDVSILELGDGVFEVKSVNGNTHLGGDDWDQEIVNYLVERIKAENGMDVTQNKTVLQRLKEAAEHAKKSLSTSHMAKIRIPFVNNGTAFKTTLKRKTFEKLSKDLLEQMIKPTQQALDDAKLKPTDIDKVILVGGSTRMPAVQNLAKRIFGSDPYTNINPDEVVAVGAAVQAGILQGEIRGIALVDVTPLSLGIEAQGGIFAKLIGRNTAIPTSAGQIFTTAVDNQTQVDIHIFQGERSLTTDNIYLGEFTLDNIPSAQRGIPQIEVTFHMDTNGVLSTSALDLHTEIEKSIILKSTQRMSDEQIKASIEDAEKYAEEDDIRTLRIRSGILAENMIAAAKLVIDEHEGNMSADDIQDIERNIVQVQDALASGEQEMIKSKTDKLKKLIKFISDALQRRSQFVDIDIHMGVESL